MQYFLTLLGTRHFCEIFQIFFHSNSLSKISFHFFSHLGLTIVHSYHDLEACILWISCGGIRTPDPLLCKPRAYQLDHQLLLLILLIIILKQKKMLATQNLGGNMLIIRSSVPKIDLKLIAEVWLHFTIRSESLLTDYTTATSFTCINGWVWEVLAN